MNICNDDCNTCQSNCKPRCPICKSNAINVPIDTVKSILIDTTEYVEEDTYLCLNYRCNVTYFNQSQYYEKHELKVPIWFKEPNDNMMVCYCYRISMLDIKKAVLEHNINNKEEIISFYNKHLRKSDCEHCNPIGKNCEQLFKNAIEYVKGER